MAKRRNSFDPDALAKAGQEIAKKHQIRENVPVKEEVVEKPTEKPVEKEKPKTVRKRTTTKKTATAKTTKSNKNEKTQLCRIGLSFHRRLKFEAVRNDMTIRQFLEELIDKNVPET